MGEDGGDLPARLTHPVYSTVCFSRVFPRVAGSLVPGHLAPDRVSKAVLPSLCKPGEEEKGRRKVGSFARQLCLCNS